MCLPVEYENKMSCFEGIKRLLILMNMTEESAHVSNRAEEQRFLQGIFSDWLDYKVSFSWERCDNIFVKNRSALDMMVFMSNYVKCVLKYLCPICVKYLCPICVAALEELYLAVLLTALHRIHFNELVLASLTRGC